MWMWINVEQPHIRWEKRCNKLHTITEVLVFYVLTYEAKKSCWKNAKKDQMMFKYIIETAATPVCQLSHFFSKRAKSTVQRYIKTIL